MAHNPNLKIYGNSQDNMLSQMAAFNMVASQKSSGNQDGLHGVMHQ